MSKQRIVVRAAAQAASGEATTTEASDWRVVTQASPSSVPASMPSTVYAYSNLQDSYDSTSNGLKTIVKFSSAYTTSSTDEAILRFSDYSDNRSSREHIDYSWDFSVTDVGALTSFAVTMRIRPITADFDCAAVTWANTVTAPTLTYGSAIEIVAWDGGFANTGDMLGFDGTFVYQLTTRLATALTFYGVIIDIKFADSQTYTGYTRWTCPFSVPTSAPHLIEIGDN